MSAEEKIARSPWLTVWFSPRRTVERLVSTWPTYFVWPLAMLGTIASLYSQISVIDSASYLLSWQLALSLVLFGAFAGVVWLYLAGFMLSGIGRWFGGQASALQMRTVFAWSSLPTILGFVVILVIATVTGRGTTLDSVPLLVVAFSVWSFVVFLMMIGRIQRFDFWRTTLTYIFYVAIGMAVWIFVRSLVYQPFNIPSASMQPTLLVGDYALVSKFAYGYSRFSLPFSLSFSGRVFSAKPAVGDVVVFRVPNDGVDYVKRVVGLPGDRIQMKQGALFINDAAVKREPLAGAEARQDACGSGARGEVTRWRETLPDGASYDTLDCLDDSSFDNTDVFTVPDGHFFVLGDNRDNSEDSRVPSLGYIPFENLIGRVSVIFFSREDGSPARVRVSRIGRAVR